MYLPLSLLTPSSTDTPYFSLYLSSKQAFSATKKEQQINMALVCSHCRISIFTLLFCDDFQKCPLFYVMDLCDYYEYRKLSNLAQNYSGCAWTREGKISVMSFICMRKSVFFSKVCTYYVIQNVLASASQCSCFLTAQWCVVPCTRVHSF